MSTQTIFEVHTLKGGQWQVDSTYQNRDQAIEVARSLFGEKIYEGVKVIQDRYDLNTGDNRESVIYDSNKQVKPRAAPAAEAEAAPAAAGRPAPAAQKPGKSGGGKDTTLALKASLLLVVILAGGLGLLYGLEYVTAWFSKLF